LNTTRQHRLRQTALQALTNYFFLPEDGTFADSSAASWDEDTVCSLKSGTTQMATGVPSQNFMRKLPESDDEVLDRIEGLVSELAAIKRWDAEKAGNRKYPPPDEILAFRARRMRYDEILPDLFELVRRLERIKNAQREIGDS
jgi:hypothetical protein